MAHRKFYLELAGLTLGLIVLALLTGLYTPLAPYQDIFWISILFFFLFSLLTYWLGNNAAQSDNKFAFTQVTFLFLFGKLLFSIFILIAYKKIADPENNLFVLPFFLVYLCYTAFETSFMMKLGRVNNQSEQK